MPEQTKAEQEGEPRRFDPPKRSGRPKGSGRYRAEMPRQAEKLCALGATDMQVADFLDIAPATLYRWKHEHPEFAAAFVTGKKQPDINVIRSLYQRALGYDIDVIKVFLPAGTKVPIYAEYSKHFPADVGAAIFWLKNRLGWRDRVEIPRVSENPLIAIIEANTRSALPDPGRPHRVAPA